MCIQKITEASLVRRTMLQFFKNWSEKLKQHKQPVDSDTQL